MKVKLINFGVFLSWNIDEKSKRIKRCKDPQIAICSLCVSSADEKLETWGKVGLGG
jgi:hypothetical protein